MPVEEISKVSWMGLVFCRWGMFSLVPVEEISKVSWLGHDMAARAAACATVPGADIRPQLATLLGKREVEIGPIRITSETPPRISIIDVAVLITGKDARKAAQDIGFVKERHTDVAQILGHVKFSTLICKADLRSKAVDEKCMRNFLTKQF